ncbi:MAG: hypothetical protein LBG60_13330 [Bifidobacteriaceae bacterium]|nr:hypothetical protein [Bifidobacteriaceae bacterium]
MSNGRPQYMGVLVQMCEALNASDERWEGYVKAVSMMQRAVGAHYAPSFLLDDSGVRAVLVTDEAQSAVFAERWPWIPAAVHVRDPWINPRDSPVAVRDNLDSEGWRVLPEAWKDWLGVTGVVVGVHAEGRHLGAVLMSFDDDRPLDHDARQFLAAAGHILGRALHSGIQARRQQELGAVKERRLLADELHVDLAQQVAALGLHAEAMSLDLLGGDQAALAADVKALTEMVANLRVTLRHRMLGLRADAAATHGSCLDAVKSQVEAFAALAPMATRVECPEPERAAAVPLDVTAQLVRVLQEALSNARIHSLASNVTVRLLVTDSCVRLEIEDDGRGFDLAAVPDTRLGLVIMRERLAGIGGQLTVRAEVGRGALVVAEAPFGHSAGAIALTERIGTFA